jgi:hypothetical protein
MRRLPSRSALARFLAAFLLAAVPVPALAGGLPTLFAQGFAPGPPEQGFAPGPPAQGFAPGPPVPQNDQDRARAAVQSGKVKPLDAILRSVRKKYRGQVLDAQLFDLGNGWIYRIRLLTQDGRVLDIGVDGRSGQIVDVRGGG